MGMNFGYAFMTLVSWIMLIDLNTETGLHAWCKPC